MAAPPSDTKVPLDRFERLGVFSTQTLIDALWGQGEAVEHVIEKKRERHQGSPGRYDPFTDATWKWKLSEEHKPRG